MISLGVKETYPALLIIKLTYVGKKILGYSWHGISLNQIYRAQVFRLSVDDAKPKQRCVPLYIYSARQM